MAGGSSKVPRLKKTLRMMPPKKPAGHRFVGAVPARNTSWRGPGQPSCQSMPLSGSMSRNVTPAGGLGSPRKCGMELMYAPQIGMAASPEERRSGAPWSKPTQTLVTMSAV